MLLPPLSQDSYNLIIWPAHQGVCTADAQMATQTQA